MEEQEGVEAIIALQALAGIMETEDRARKSWRRLPEEGKLVTMASFEMFVKKGEGRIVGRILPDK